MENMLVGVFDSEAQARDASLALEKLAEADTIGLNAGAIVTKSAGGAITVSGAHRPVFSRSEGWCSAARSPTWRTRSTRRKSPRSSGG